MGKMPHVVGDGPLGMRISMDDRPENDILTQVYDRRQEHICFGHPLFVRLKTMKISLSVADRHSERGDVV
jgi:hypothetical protein